MLVSSYLEIIGSPGSKAVGVRYFVSQAPKIVGSAADKVTGKEAPSKCDGWSMNMGAKIATYPSL